MWEYCISANTTTILSVPSPVSSSYSQFQQYASNSAMSPIHLDHPEDLHIILNCLQASVLLHSLSRSPISCCFWKMPAGWLEMAGMFLLASMKGKCWQLLGSLTVGLSNVVCNPCWYHRINKSLSITSGKRQNPRQQKDLWLYNMLLKISADGHKTERISQKNCMM